MGERRGSHMYDPARDIFTASDDGPLEPADEPTPIDQKRKRSSLQDVDDKEEGLMQNKDSRPVSEAFKDDDDSPSAKKPRTTPPGIPISLARTEAPKPITAASLAQISVKKRAPGEPRNIPPRQQGRRRSRSPGRNLEDRGPRRERRSPPRRRSASPKPITRSPSPPGRSPPRQRKRPGAAARISTVDQETVKRRQEEREQGLRDQAQAEGAARGVHDVVKQHYNQVPQRGREWRKTGSLIKGLRSLNNWIKSAIIQKFSPNEDYTPGARRNGNNDERQTDGGILVLDIGCGKGGDLQKWQLAPQRVDLYVGLDPADVSIDQAKERFTQMRQERRGSRNQNFQAEFFVKDCFGEWLGDIPIVQEVGIDGSVGPEGNGHSKRWGGGGFDVVSMMFCMHYAFESEAKARGMLRNVAGSLKKGGRFLGVIPNSDILTAKVLEFQAKKGKTVPTSKDEDDDDDDWDPEKTLDQDGKDRGADESAENGEDSQKQEESLEWGNDIYRVKFPGKVPDDGVFRPPFGWKYFYFLEEAVEEVPEYVVPWEAFRAMAVDYDLELQYRKPFGEVWDAEKDDPSLGPLSERMGVRERNRGPLLVSDKEFEAANFYHAFCFYKV